MNYIAITILTLVYLGVGFSMAMEECTFRPEREWGHAPIWQFLLMWAFGPALALTFYIGPFIAVFWALGQLAT